MDKIRTTLACVFGTLSKDITENPKLVTAYVVVLVLTGVVMGLFWYIPNSMSSTTNLPGAQSANYLAGLVSQSLVAMLFVCIACLLRRYWPFYGAILAAYTVYALYLTAMATTNNPEPIDRLGLLTVIVVTAVEILLVPALMFFGLCCLAGLPRPHSRGWGACLKEKSFGGVRRQEARSQERR